MNKERITYFDLFKGLLILSVILEHLIEVNSTLATPWKEHPILCMTTSFNMVAFFVISGYMLHFSLKHIDSAKQLLLHIKKRALQCLVPWFAWGG